MPMTAPATEQTTAPAATGILCPATAPTAGKRNQ
jgi:hypothetical protein